MISYHTYKEKLFNYNLTHAASCNINTNKQFSMSLQRFFSTYQILFILSSLPSGYLLIFTFSQQSTQWLSVYIHFFSAVYPVVICLYSFFLSSLPSGYLLSLFRILFSMRQSYWCIYWNLGLTFCYFLVLDSVLLCCISDNPLQMTLLSFNRGQKLDECQ